MTTTSLQDQLDEITANPYGFARMMAARQKFSR
jgi:hypothetical protein